MGKTPDDLTEADEEFFAEKARNVRLSLRLYYLLWWVNRAEKENMNDLLDDAALDPLEARYRDNEKMIAAIQEAMREKAKRKSDRRADR